MQKDTLTHLRHALLDLHKQLVNSTRELEETARGININPHQWWSMLSSDERFAWLRPFTSLIVAIDETLDQPEPTCDAMTALRDQARELIRSGSGTEAWQAALQQSPEAIIAHSEALALTSRPGASGPS